MSESKGLFAMFGAAAPAPAPAPIKKAEDIKTKEELAREAAYALKHKKQINGAASSSAAAAATANGPSGGGAWKTASKRGSRGLALKARSMGKTVTVTESKTMVPDVDDGDVAMGGMGKKKKRL